MKNIGKIFLKGLKRFGDMNLSIILFVFYILFFFPYKCFFIIFGKKEQVSGWKKSEKFEESRKFLPY